MQYQQSETLLNTALHFELDNIGLSDPRVENHVEINDPQSWITNVVKCKNKRCGELDFSAEILPETSMIPGTTHSGLIHYIFYAWAKELGVVLKPDVLYYTIVFEINDTINKNSDSYRHLFTDSQTKKNIVLVDLTIDKLMKVLQDLIPCKELFKAVNLVNFTCASENYTTAMNITMADMGTPFYSYFTTRCGIPKVAICGVKKDWLILKQATETLSGIFTDCKILKSYLLDVIVTIDDIIKYAFDEHSVDYFKKMFNYGKNPKCGSGHEPVVTSGWIRKFYIGQYSEYGRYGYSDMINHYTSHLSCLPYADEDQEPHKYYVYTSGLCSHLIGDYLYPEFNILHARLDGTDSEKMFKILAKRE